MASTSKQLVQAALAATTTVIYTCTVKTIVKEITICNTTATTKAVTINFVPSAGSPAIANTILSALDVGPYDTKIISLSTVIDTAGTIDAFASLASSVGVTISGIEVT